MVNNLIELIILSVLGSSLGSFSMSLITRFCEKKDLFCLRSYCFFCQKKLGFFELIPIFSYILLGARCKTCKHKLPFYIFLAECLGIIFIFMAHSLSKNIYEFMYLSIFLFILFILSCIDIKFKAVPEKLLWLGFFTGLCFAFDLEEVRSFFIFGNFSNALLVQMFAFAGFLFLLKHLIAFVKSFKTRHKEENLGDADIIILASIAAMYGFKIAFIILFIASCLSLPFFLYKRGLKLAFLPFIHLAFLLYLLSLIFGIVS